MADLVKEKEPPIINQRYGLGVRHVQAAMMFLAMLIGYTMRVNVNIAIVDMTDQSKDNSFEWSIQTQSVILSSFFWGYFVLQIPGGVLATKIGGMRLILGLIAFNSIITLFMPFAAYYGGWQMVCAFRLVQGLTQGSLLPCTHNLISKWIPLEEKSKLGTFIYSGGQLGTAVQWISAGFIADAFGWPSIFYVNGAVGIVWSVLYFFIGADSPATSKFISNEERLYIQTSLGQVQKQKKLPIPWRKMMTSLPFISLIIVNCGQNWGFWTLMTEIPSYMGNVLGVDIKSNGVISALPYISMFAMGFPLGYFSDLMVRKNWLSITAVRKISNTLGFWGPALALIALGYAPAGNVAAAVGVLCVVVGLNAGHYTGYLLVHIDMAPNFAGIMMGITNSAANLISILAPLIAGLFLKDETSADDWRNVFYLASAIYFAGNLIFLVFGSSERQLWNEPETGFWGPALALIALGYAPAGNVAAAVGVLCVVVGLNAGHYTGYLLVHIDMAPNFAGIMMGITNSAANLISILAPLIAGLFLKDETSADDWRNVFYLASAIYFAGNLIFLVFGSSERQLWNEPETEKSKEARKSVAT